MNPMGAVPRLKLSRFSLALPIAGKLTSTAVARTGPCGRPWSGLVPGADGLLYCTEVRGRSRGGGGSGLEADAGSTIGWNVNVLHEFPNPSRTGLNQTYRIAGKMEIGRDGWLYGARALEGGAPSYGCGVLPISTDVHQ